MVAIKTFDEADASSLTSWTVLCMSGGRGVLNYIAQNNNVNKDIADSLIHV